MDEVTFVVPGDPRGKGAARATIRGDFASVYKDGKTRSYEKQVGAKALEAMGGRPPFEGALAIDMVAYFPIPKSTPKRRFADMVAGLMRPTKKPDLSNVLKAVEDGCKGAKGKPSIVFLDDSQVVEVRMKKVYSERPRVWVRIYEWKFIQ
jgi:Holliday junction resolvase RusA-like endonuclease